MAERQVLSPYIVAGMILISMTGILNPILMDFASAQPDDGINGYQELHEDWTVTGYEEYTDEIIALWGDLTIQDGGHLVLNNCTLMMMSEYLQPYEIIVENNGTLEVYNGYITDTPDDDDTELLSNYYYFVARKDSTLIIENSTVRQSGFIDLTDPEHLGLSISTNMGHIKNSRINTTIVGLAFFGNNSGFYVENSNISQIGMVAIMMNNAEGVVLNNISFSETGESNVVDSQYSSNFIVENFNLQGEQFIRAEYSYGFEIRNIMATSPERVLEINNCDGFLVLGVDIVNSQAWNRRISVEHCTNFSFDDISDNDDTNVMFFGECSFGSISNLSGSNITWMIDSEKSNNITVNDVNIGGNEYVIRFTDSQNITMNRVNIAGGRYPIYLDTVNGSSILDLTVTDLQETAINIIDYSNNISITNAYIETNVMTFTRGIVIDYGYDIYLKNIETNNLNLSIRCNFGDLYAEDVKIHGTLDQKYGVRLHETRNVYLKNIDMLNNLQYGITQYRCVGNTRVDDLYIVYADRGMDIYQSNVTIENIVIDNSLEDIFVNDKSTATVMNSTVDKLVLFSADIILINSTNTTFADFLGLSQLIIKWWVDVYVDDKTGPIAGATVYIVDGSFMEDARGTTGSDGFARNLAATEVIWTFGPTADNKNPHKTEATGPGWLADNLTFYQVDRNKWVNVTYSGDAPPAEPSNLRSYADEMSNTVLTWDPSISLDVIGYNIYISKTWADLWSYVASGIPNATAAGSTFTHLGGSWDWQKYYYGVTTYDNENESIVFISSELGDWVVNSSSPQIIQNEDIILYGSLYVYGDLELHNTNLTIITFGDEIGGILVNNSGSFLAENFKAIRNINYPYYFKIKPDADVFINNSEIQQPGSDTFLGDWENIGIHSLTSNITVTNSVIDVMYGGLSINDVSNFQGLIYNVSFVTTFVIEQADFLLCVANSTNVAIDNCSFNGVTRYGIYGEASSGLGVRKNHIQVYSYSQLPAWGIVFISCSNSRIYDNPLIRGKPAIYILYSINITVENSNISGHSQYGIHVESSWYTSITSCYYDRESERPEIGIYMSWCSESTIRDMDSAEVNYFLLMENETGAIIENLSITSGDLAITLRNSDYILFKDIHIYFISNGMMIIGGHEITLYNLTINLTLYGLLCRSAGPVYLINCTLANCISGELTAEGYEGEAGNIIVENSTIAPIAEYSLILNSSAVIYLVNTPFNTSKLNIKDGASRLEIFHYLSVQVKDIDNNIPTFANITIMNTNDDVVYDMTAPSGFAEWILIHEKPIFRDNIYFNNPYNIYVFDGNHLGNLKVNINYSQHLEVQVANQFPIITLIGIIGYYDNPFPIPDDFTLFPTTKYDIVLSYTYEDPENDPESGTIIHWYVNGIYNSSFDGYTTITPQDTQKGQLWQAYVYPSDGYNSTYPFYAFESNIIPILNTPPSVFNVTISPSDPTGGDDLFVTFDVYDMDDDGLDASKTTSKWYIYNEGIGDWDYSSIDSFYLPSQYTSKGQIWKCVVTPHDG
ncbi:MAG: right-handed parallel beta-helix repeat-containing protein, partial [Thermoplasmata archaeon]